MNSLLCAAAVPSGAAAFRLYRTRRNAELVLERTRESRQGGESYLVGHFADVVVPGLEKFHGPVETIVGQERLRGLPGEGLYL